MPPHQAVPFNLLRRTFQESHHSTTVRNEKKGMANMQAIRDAATHRVMTVTTPTMKVGTQTGEIARVATPVHPEGRALIACSSLIIRSEGHRATQLLRFVPAHVPVVAELLNPNGRLCQDCKCPCLVPLPLCLGKSCAELMGLGG